ncbi:choice-of-anchor G family protein [Agrococcus jejuensis]|uniref:Putative cell wall binding repeat 2 n=1 Tax=Agrococcus jejuensis TaxID=399736 RepID=A0A1G8EC86_9MICO|nr:choice-of-anchor G family protein [Agrococcus jejuensis]SDH67309.1 Putative cell wall binding repeat 2 [Agrococcus jejuensis]
MRRTATWKPIAGVAAAAIAIAGFGVAPASAAPGDTAEAFGEVLGVELLGSDDLLATAFSQSAFPSNPGIDSNGLNLGLLGGELEVIEDGLTVPLLHAGQDNGLLELGGAGVLSSYADASSANDAVAAAGLLDEDGGLQLDPNEEPPSGTGSSSVDLTALLGSLGVDAVTDEIVDQVSLELGAFGSHATEVDDAFDSEYLLTDLTLDVHSDLVAGITTQLRTGLTGVTIDLRTDLNGLAGPDGAVQDVLDGLNVDLNALGLASLTLDDIQVNVTAPDLSAAVDTALGGSNGVLVSDDQSVTIDLATGAVSVDLAQIVNPDGIGLNGLDPNTQILDADTIQALTTGIASALGDITTPLTNSVSTLLNTTSLTVGIDVAASAALPLGVGTIPIIDGSILISGTIGQFANGTATSTVNIALIPGLIASLGPIVGPAVQGLVNGLVSGLTTELVGTIVPAIVAGLATPVANILAASSGDVSTAIQGVVVGATNLLSPALSGVASNIASITVNVQPHLVAGGGQPFATNRDGYSTMSGTEEVDIPDGYTVRAMTITLLPNALGSNLANIDLGSSSVSNVEPSAVAGTLELTPPRVHQGDTVDIAGSGWNPDGGPVTVAFVDENENPVGAPVTATLDGEGGITGTFTVPGDTAIGTLTGTATQDGAPASASVDVFGPPVIIVDPEPPLDPGTPVTISGEGFICGPLTVDILDGTDVIDTFTDVPVSETDGSWSVVWEVPEDIDVTQVTIRAYGSGECEEDEETPVDIDLPEEFDVAQAEARLGDVLDITGAGWTEGTDVTVTFSHDGTPVGSPVTIPPGTGGSLDGTFTVPTDAPLGTLDATAVQGDDTLTDAVEIFGAATVAVDPPSVRVGATVDVTGGGWLPAGGDVVVTFTQGGAPIGTVTIAEADIADDGTIADQFAIPAGTATGSVIVTAVQGDEDAATSLTVVPEPSVTVTPGIARPLDTVQVGGSGWGPGDVTVIFTNELDEPVGEPLVITPADGVIADEFLVPDGTPAGTLTATATQGVDTATTELEVTLAPTVTATPGRVHDEDTVTIGGSGWGDDDVTVTIIEGEPPLVLTPVDGVITGTFTIPDGTGPADLTVTADDGTDEATTPLEVLEDAVVTADPDPVDPGDPVTITGTGFLCGPVDITIASGSTVVATYALVPVIDGEWTQIWTVPTGIDVDSVTITAVTSASAPCDDEGETELEIDLEETLAATPPVVQRGQVVTVSGTGWSDGTVSIIATATGGAVVGSFTATSADSAFSQGFYVLGEVPLGPLTFTAVQDGKTETATVTVVQVPAGPATLIVSPSAVEPGQLVALDGEGWDPTQGTVAVSVTDEDSVVLGTVPVSVAPDGALVTGAFQVPPTVTAPQTLTATGVQGPRSASDTFSVRAAGDPVIRLAGPDRFQTAVEISRDAFPFGADVVYLANGLKFPDALSAAPAAAQQDAPLLLTRQEYLEPSVIQELDRLDPDIVVILGDENSVSANVASQVDPYAGDIVRLGGANRFETSILIAEYAFNGADSAYIATGLNFPDALTAGAAAGALNAPLLLTYGATPTPGLISSLQDLGVEDLYIAGDANAVATSQEAAFQSAGFTIAERYAGANRFDTGVLVAQDSFAGSADRIYVATGLRFPDALAGSAIAGAQGVPVFVTRPTCMWADVLGEVDRLDDPQIVLLGDQNALDQSVFDLTACTG